MLFLLLAILSSALVSLMMRASETHIQSKSGLLVINYVVCCTTAALDAGPTRLFPNRPELPVTLGLGLITGLFYLGSFLLLQWNVRVNGVVPAAAFMKLGVLVPTLLSMALFGEMPTALQLGGSCLALVAILIINTEKGGDKAKSQVGLLALLLVGGLSDVLPKFHTQYSVAELEGNYLFYTFGVALILCALLTAARREKLGKQELLYGLLIGLPNYFSSRFLLGALGQLTAVIVYPSFSVATILVITVAGQVFFREKLTRRQLVGGAFILAALALLNL